MVEPADRSSTAGQRLGAPESYGVSTLEPGLQPPGGPGSGRQVSIRVQMLDDTQEVFEISVSSVFALILSLLCLYIYFWNFWTTLMVQGNLNSYLILAAEYINITVSLSSHVLY